MSIGKKGEGLGYCKHLVVMISFMHLYIEVHSNAGVSRNVMLFLYLFSYFQTHIANRKRFKIVPGTIIVLSYTISDMLS